ncbi:MAG: ATP-dependent DNA helicase [Candidatus Saccharibacteria bacterium]|nr:ATP-dependent DNA helicase [Candidatus Saccharibacteria bacterium]
MPLNAEQKRAVEYLEGPLLVLAGPGTGKTQLLSSKVKYILEQTDTNPDNILCLTFTENGAQNMRDRLFSMIGQAAGQVAIHTYHAFGSVILAAYKNYATEFDRKLDNPIDPVTQYKIIKNIQAQLDGRDILRGDKIKDIIDVIASAKSARLTATDLKRIAEDNLKITEELREKIQAPLSNLVKNMKVPAALEQVYRPLYETLTSIEVKELAPGFFREVNEYAIELHKIIDEQEIALAEVEQLGKSAAKKPTVTALNKWKDKRFERDEDGGYRFKNLIANRKLLSLANVMNQYDEKLKAEGWFDFSDMIEQAIYILKHDEGFRLTLAERFQYILLDEFQDTNPSQAELIYLLTDGVESPAIMAVGDDDQAIFEFQGANASNLYEFQKHFSAEYINLSRNYRSTADVLSLGRKVADQIENSFSKQNAVEKKLSAERDGDIRKGSQQTVVERHEFISADGEYYWIANQIADLIKSGVHQSEIAIIAPKHKYIAGLLPYLKSHAEINISYEKRENLFEDQAIAELLMVARFIYELSEEKQPSYRLLQLLSCSFWEIERTAAMKVAVRDRDKTLIERLESSGDSKIQALAQTLAELVAFSYEAPLELFIDKLLADTGMAKYYCTDDNTTFSFYEKLGSLRKVLKDHLHVEQPRLKDLIEFVDDYLDADTPLTLTSPYQDSSDSVQIVTAHKSKGLEYEYVFIIATDNLAWGKAKGNNSLLTLPANLTKIRHTGITDDERLRLFFVAITRAKACLYLTNSKVDFSGKNVARLDYLEEYEQDEKVLSPLLGSEIILHYADLEEAKKETNLQSSWVANYVKYVAPLKPQLLKTLEHYALSASDLTSFIDIVYAGPEAFFLRRILKVDSEPASESAMYGTLIHATFEQVTSRGISDQEAMDFFKSEAEKMPILESERRPLIERGLHGLEVSLKTFASILRNPDARAEVDLRSEHLHLGEVPIDGVIDHINIDQEHKTIEIYDFKTGNYKEKKWDSDSTLYKYKLQLGFYKLLLNLSPTYRGYKVERAHILFVSPDAERDQVHDKVYEFNDADEDELKELIRAVYVHIKTLDFLDREDLRLPTDKTKSLKDIKEFTNHLIETAPLPVAEM